MQQDGGERSVGLVRLLTRTGRVDEGTRGHLYAVVLHLQQHRGQAQSVLQEVCVKAWRAARTL